MVAARVLRAVAGPRTLLCALVFTAGVLSAFLVNHTVCLMSNVPFVILAGESIPRLADPRFLRLATALAATLAGNLAVIGSIANVVVLEIAGSRACIGFWAVLRIGAAVASATLAAALALLLAERALGLR
jgi:Na+/H+ antiporter NhaD/arsenite permease-like protein